MEKPDSSKIRQFWHACLLPPRPSAKYFVFASFLTPKSVLVWLSPFFVWRERWLLVKGVCLVSFLSFFFIFNQKRCVVFLLRPRIYCFRQKVPKSSISGLPTSGFAWRSSLAKFSGLIQSHSQIHMAVWEAFKTIQSGSLKRVVALKATPNRRVYLQHGDHSSSLNFRFAWPI